VLISDGGGVTDAALTEAVRLRDTGAQLSTLVVLPTEGPPALPPGDPAALARLAEAGGGSATDPRGIGALSQQLARSGSRSFAAGDLGALLFRDMGRWLLLLAMIPAALMFARRA
jgi:Ca-activated chloride channel family protein